MQAANSGRSYPVRRAARKDANHQSVSDYLSALGWSVLDLSRAGFGVPDLAVSKPGFCCLVEVKDGTKPPSERKLTPEQQEIRARWQGPYVIALSGEDAALQLLCLLNGWEK